MPTPDDMMTVDEAIAAFTSIGAQFHKFRQEALAISPETVIRLDPLLFEMRQQAEAIHPRVAEAFNKAVFPNF